MDASRRRRVRTGEVVQLDLLRGLRIAESIAGPSLGPRGVPILMAPTGSRSRPPERIDDAATALRRVLETEDADANPGLMLARHAAWRLAQAQGDGSATAVVMAAAAHGALVRAGSEARDAVAIREAFDAAARRAEGAVLSMARPISGDHLIVIAERIIGDDDLAAMVVEAVTRMGPNGSTVARDAPGDTGSVQFVDGAMWETRPASIDVLDSCAERRLTLPAPAVLIWDTTLEDVRGLADLLGRSAAAGVKDLLVVAPAFSSTVLGMLAANRGVVRSAPVNAPMAGTHQRWALDDLAAITGSSAFGVARGDRLSEIPTAALGRARRAIVTSRSLDVAGPSRPTEAAQRQLAAARHLLEIEDDPVESRSLRERIGRLEGGMAIIWVGGRTPTEQAERRRSVDSGLRRLSAVARGGAVPGGGSALVMAAPNPDDRAAPGARAAERALTAGLERPGWWIARNARQDPRRALASVRGAGRASAFDVLEGRVVDAWATGLLDATEVVTASIRSGVSAASLALSAAGIVASRRLERPSLRP